MFGKAFYSDIARFSRNPPPPKKKKANRHTQKEKKKREKKKTEGQQEWHLTSKYLCFHSFSYFLSFYSSCFLVVATAGAFSSSLFFLNFSSFWLGGWERKVDTCFLQGAYTASQGAQHGRDKLSNLLRLNKT